MAFYIPAAISAYCAYLCFKRNIGRTKGWPFVVLAIASAILGWFS